jgi:enoyl-CoA hydratase
MRLVLTGELVAADEALRIGLVDLVFPAAELRERVLEIAATMAEPVAGGARHGEGRGARGRRDAARRRARLREGALRHLLRERGSTEGVAAFLEKRDARFQGN